MKKATQTKLVVRDSILSFLICYGAMVLSLGRNGLSFIEMIPFIVAALAPTLVVTAISTEIRMPSTKDEVEDQVEYGFKKLA